MEGFVILAMCALIGGSVAFPNGAPPEACQKMAPSTKPMPNGHGAEPSTGPFPYTVTCEQISADEIKVTVGGPVFKGLLLQIRDGKNKAVGRFMSVDAAFKDACTQGKAVTHRDNIPKTSPAMFKSKVANVENVAALQCVVTVVQKADTYWVAHTVNVTTPENAVVVPIEAAPGPKSERPFAGEVAPGPRSERPSGGEPGNERSQSRKDRKAARKAERRANRQNNRRNRQGRGNGQNQKSRGVRGQQRNRKMKKSKQ